MNATSNASEALVAANRQGSSWRFLVRVLTPIVRILLRFGYGCEEINQAINKIAVDTALNHPEFFGRKKAFVSHASVVTGLSRKEVSKLRDAEEVSDVVGTRLMNRATRVLCGWHNDARYRDPDNTEAPRLRLPFQASSGVSFYQLAREYGGDIPPRSALDMLIKSGAVRRLENNEIELINPYYLPEAGSDERIEHATLCASDVLSTLEHNLRTDHPPSRLFREWFQRYVPEQNVAQAQQIVREAAMQFGERIDEQLARLAHRSPLANQRYTRVGMGIFYFEEEAEARKK